jgi:hypothetical protein
MLQTLEAPLEFKNEASEEAWSTKPADGYV